MPGKQPQLFCVYFDSAQRSPNFQQRANRSLQLAQNDVEIEQIYESYSCYLWIFVTY